MNDSVSITNILPTKHYGLSNSTLANLSEFEKHKTTKRLTDQKLSTSRPWNK